MARRVRDDRRANSSKRAEDKKLLGMRTGCLAGDLETAHLALGLRCTRTPHAEYQVH